MRPVITVILPSLNVSEYIRKCIDSVISQTYTNLEILCVDAGSTDGTLEIIEDYASADKRIHIINSDRKSYGYQVNTALRKAGGTYIAIVDTDDYIEKEMYQNLIEKTDGTIDIVKCNASGFKMIDGITMRREIRGLSDDGMYGHVISGDYLFRCPHTDSSIWNGIYRKDLLLDNNIWLNESYGASYQDIGLRYQVFAHAKTAYYIDRSLYDYRMDRGESSAYSYKALSNFINEFFRLINKIFPSHDIPHEAWNTLWEDEISYFFGEFNRTIRLADYDVTKAFIAEPYQTFSKLVEEHPEEIHHALDALDNATRVNFDLIMSDINCFVEYRKSVDRVMQRSAEQIIEDADGRHLVIVGNGIRGRNLYLQCFDYCIPVDAYADNDSTKWTHDGSFSPMVLSPEKAVTEYHDDVFFIANRNHENELEEQLVNLGIDKKRIVKWHP